MFKFLKSKKKAPSAQENVLEATPEKAVQSWFSKLNQGLAKTRRSLVDQMANVVLGKKQIDAELLAELETILLTADVGISVCDYLMEQLKQQLARKELDNPERLTAV